MKQASDPASRESVRRVSTLGRRLTIAAILLAITVSTALAAIPKGAKTVELQRVAAALVSPIGLTHAGDGRLFVVDQVGQIRVIDSGGLRATPFLDLSSKMVALRTGYDERGLLGLAFHPNYAQNHKFYVYYSAPGAPTGWNHHSVVSEFTASGDPNLANPLSERVLMTFDEPQSNHNGVHLVLP